MRSGGRQRGGRAFTVAIAAWAIAIPGLALVTAQQDASAPRSQIGREVSIPRHLADDEEFRISLEELVEHGRRLFAANWTEQEGGGRPLSKGNGRELSDPSRPLVGTRAFNRISAPDANSCAGCHNAPYGITGGGGDFVTNVFVQAQRFDFVTFDRTDDRPIGQALDEGLKPVTLQTVGNSRATPGMFGAGYLEMLAREITRDLHAIRDTIKHGESKPLVSKGISFGVLTRRADGMWDTSKVEGLPRLSVLAPLPIEPPTLIVRPWHQVANVVSLREFSNTAFNHHHGIQSTERFGVNTDLDGDGFTNEMTRADMTAVTVYQATLAAPGRVIPNDPAVERAVLAGEEAFGRIGCASCHVPELPLVAGSMYSEPSPYNPTLNLRTGQTKELRIDLSDPSLPQPRLHPDRSGVIRVAAYTDFKLHDITDPADPAEAEAIDMNQSVVSPRFRQGNRRFLTKRLWGAANEPPYFHHGLFTTLRQAVLAHNGEALQSRLAFQRLTPAEQDGLIEFLKTLQVLPPGTKDLIVDEHFQKKQWPPADRRTSLH
jgi:hypothetical protein